MTTGNTPPQETKITKNVKELIRKLEEARYMLENGALIEEREVAGFLKLVDHDNNVWQRHIQDACIGALRMRQQPGLMEKKELKKLLKQILKNPRLILEFQNSFHDIPAWNNAQEYLLSHYAQQLDVLFKAYDNAKEKDKEKILEIMFPNLQEKTRKKIIEMKVSMGFIQNKLYTIPEEQQETSIGNLEKNIATFLTGEKKKNPSPEEQSFFEHELAFLFNYFEFGSRVYNSSQDSTQKGTASSAEIIDIIQNMITVPQIVFAQRIKQGPYRAFFTSPEKTIELLGVGHNFVSSVEVANFVGFFFSQEFLDVDPDDPADFKGAVLEIISVFQKISEGPLSKEKYEFLFQKYVTDQKNTVNPGSLPRTPEGWFDAWQKSLKKSK